MKFFIFILLFQLETLFAQTAFVEGYNTSSPNLQRTLPALNTPYIDDAYGTTVTRITDASVAQDRYPASWIRHEYSRKPSFNADSTRAVMISSNGWMRLFSVDKTTNKMTFLKTLTLAEVQEPIWHPTDPNLIYHLGYYGEGLTISQYDIRTDQTSILRDLKTRVQSLLPGAHRMWTKQEGRPSNDGKIWCLQVEDSSYAMKGIISYDLVNDRIVGHMASTNRPDHISTSPLGNYCVPSWVDSTGTRAYSLDFSRFTQLHTTSEHSDLAITADQKEVYVFTDYQSGDVAMVDLSSGSRTNLFRLYGENNSGTAMHISGIGSEQTPGFALMSFYGCFTNYGANACPYSSQWFRDKVVLVELKANPKIINLAHTRYANAGYFSETQATSNKDYSKVLFVSSWESTAENSVASYMVNVPVNSIQGSSNPVNPPLTGGGLPSGSSIRVLFVGNSLTNTPPDASSYSLGAMPARLAPMLQELGIAMTFDARIQGGAEFRDHAANPTTMTAIGSGYDIVNLQGYYQGFGSSSEYVNAVQPLYNAAKNAGSKLLFEAVWEYRGNGSPTFNSIDSSTQGAAEYYADAYQVQVAHAWNEIKITNPTLYAKLFTDSTHQSLAGEYLTTLVYARFFSGRSIANVNYIFNETAPLLNNSERSALKAAVEKTVTKFYQPSSRPTATLNISNPTEGQVVPSGSLVVRGIASDTSSGDISQNIQWLDNQGNILAIGSTLTLFLTSDGPRSLIASVTGSDGKPISQTRNFTVNSQTLNQSPVTTNSSANIAHNAAFTQVNLTSRATDVDGSIDWSSLELDLLQFKGKGAVQSSQDLATVNFDYSNSYAGADSIRWRVKDNAGAFSNWSTISLTVAEGAGTTPPPSALSIQVVQATRTGDYSGSVQVNSNVAALCRLATSDQYSYDALYDDFTTVTTGLSHSKATSFGDTGIQTRYAVCKSVDGSSQAVATIVFPIYSSGGSSGGGSGGGSGTTPTPPASLKLSIQSIKRVNTYTASVVIKSNVKTQCRMTNLSGYKYDQLYINLVSDSKHLKHSRTEGLSGPGAHTRYVVCKSDTSTDEKEIQIQIPSN